MMVMREKDEITQIFEGKYVVKISLVHDGI
jgi:hypothetical protein